MYFENRYQAGELLGQELKKRGDQAGAPLVLALPRGGVPVASEVAKALGVALDVYVVRKLGVPGHEELAFGAIAPAQMMVINHPLLARLGISEARVQKVIANETVELHRRQKLYRQGKEALDVRGQKIILVDDGVATGATMRVACEALRQQQVASLTIAVPVASGQAYEVLRQEADEIVCLKTPEPFFGVGRWYYDFNQTSDEEVIELLRLSQRSANHPQVGSAS